MENGGIALILTRNHHCRCMEERESYLQGLRLFIGNESMNGVVFLNAVSKTIFPLSLKNGYCPNFSAKCSATASVNARTVYVYSARKII